MSSYKTVMSIRYRKRVANRAPFGIAHEALEERKRNSLSRRTMAGYNQRESPLRRYIALTAPRGATSEALIKKNEKDT